jgi:hypothetical protein
MTESIMPEILMQYRGTHEYLLDLAETLTEKHLDVDAQCHSAVKMNSGKLGYAETCRSMEDDAANTLQTPSKSVLLEYARRAFENSQGTVSTISDDKFYQVYKDLHGNNWNEGKIGPTISDWLAHDNRRLGMIEASLESKACMAAQTVGRTIPQTQAVTFHRK